ncbi:segmentation protein cap'n'collar isoform X4 [Anabrus simplex]|uniref:segmentation protein cap'n'collar isoform X4 n=1 Tax=Anabrus simplex TaxID=316456 RepID=UPI0034DCEA07
MFGSKDPILSHTRDMDLIEVLWKQDVDLGFSLDLFNKSPARDKQDEPEDEIEKLKELKRTALKKDDEDGSCTEESLDPWAGLAYTVDLETGEYVLKDALEEELNDTSTGLPSTDEEPSALIDLPEFSLEEALQLVGLEEEEEVAEPSKAESTASESSPKPAEADATDEDLGILGDMMQTVQFQHPAAPRPFHQGRMPFVRAMSMEQRWQDLASLLALPAPGDHHPFAHHHHHYGGGGYPPDNGRGVLLHNATLAPPMGDLNASSPYPNMSGGASNLGSAVATSMNLTNSSEPMGESSPAGPYKMEGPHDMMYYQNSSAEINQTTEGFLSSILNDEDLQLMDMAMNEGMYTMRMLENNSSNNTSSSASLPPVVPVSHEERMDASSDSAVSSMGSERVPSLSDGEWMETGSDSGHTAGDHYAVDYHNSKYRPYDYSYSSRQLSGAAVSTTETAAHRMPPMAQKKHQLYGKRCFQDQGSGASSLGSHGPAASLPTPTPIKYEYGSEAATTGNAFSGPVDTKPPELKYSCSMEFARHLRPSMEQVHHNHSYHVPPESSGAMQRPVARDKLKGRKSEEEHLNRDEKRARAMNIPITVNDIINLPMDEFNERLSKYDLSEAQLSLIRDIRRRGKNKVAAQNCRKRKLDQILSLADEVREMRDRKNRLLIERDYMLSERQRVKEKFSQLYRHVFQSLRDPDGNPYSPYEYSLQQSADGTVLLVPRSNATGMLETDMTRQKHKDQHKE